MRTSLRPIVCAFVLCLAWNTCARGEGPSLTRLFPPGGMRGSTVDVRLTGKFPNGPLKLWAYPAGLTWEAVEREKDLYRITIPSSATPGIYYLRGFDAQGATKLVRFVVGTVPERTEVEPNQETHEVETLSDLPVVINGILQKRGDVDHFRVQVPAGKTLVASVESHEQLGSPADVSLQLVEPRGNLVAQNLDYHGLDPQVAWTAKQDYEIIVRVFAYPATPDSTISFAGGDDYAYRLSLTTGPYVEATLPIGRSAETTSVRLLGYNLPADTSHPIEVDATAATQVLASTDFLGGVSLPWIPQRIVVRDSPSTEPLATDLPVSVHGCLALHDQRDTLRVQAKAGEVWRVRVESRGLGFPIDPLLRIEDATGKELQRVDDTNKQADPEVTWKVAKDGEYLIHVQDLNGHANPRSVYRMTIDREVPRVALAVTGDSYSGKIDEALEIAVTVQREGGFDAEIPLTITGLPETVTYQPVVSAAKGNTAKSVKLVLKSSAAWTGPIQIVAAVPGEETPRTVVLQDTPVHDLWVTFQ